MRAETKLRYPALYQALAGYFHEDWDDTAREQGLQASEELVLRRMIADAPESRIRARISDIERLLLGTKDETTLREIVCHDIAAHVEPSTHGHTMRSWLEHVADLHRESLTNRTFWRR